MKKTQFDVAIIGGGVTGTALLYVLSRYTSVNRIVLLEKCDSIASIASDGRQNSQTIHCGDIETNYSLEKAVKVQKAAQLLVNFAENLGQVDIMRRYPKMVLGVGDEEVEAMRKRFDVFSPHFASMKLFGHEDIGRIEPNIIKANKNGDARQESLIAMGSEHDFCAIDYSALAYHFVKEAHLSEKTLEIALNTHVNAINRTSEGFHIQSSNGLIEADAVIVAAGNHSLLLAQQMGYGEQFGGIPVAGNFYYAPQVLNGKVYTVQNDKLPFAAVHGDPDVLVDGKTRFGPTALMLPLIERRHMKTFFDFLKLSNYDMAVMRVAWDLMKDADIRRFMLKNMLYTLPFLGRHLFLQQARKIVPSLSYSDIHYAKGVGGIRLQIIDKVQKKLLLGEAKINEGDGILFNMTPSPGATSCLANAVEDASTICDYLNASFDTELFQDKLRPLQ